MTEKHTTVQIRVYNPRVDYPAGNVLAADCVYVASDGIVFTATKVKRRPKYLIFSHCSWLDPEEIRLLASIALSIPEGRGTVCFAPAQVMRQVRVPHRKHLRSKEVLSFLTECALDLVKQIYGEETRYSHRPVESSGIEFQRALLAAIDIRDELLIRGLYTLLKSQHLQYADGYAFMEDALMNVQISREAALELIREHLHFLGNKNPSFRDAHDYISSNFRAGDHLAKFFGDQHSLWIKTKHPNSNFGVYWAPPMIADDFLETYEALVSVYRHLLTEEPGRATAYLGLPDDLE